MRTTSLFNDYAVLASSGLFDAEYYRLRNPDLSAQIDPLLHYLERGAIEGRDPAPDFDTAHYLEQCRRLDEMPDNPLLHYITVGMARGLEPVPGTKRDQRLQLAIDTPELIDGVARPVVGATSLVISGWALGNKGVAGIEIAIDGGFAAAAYYGIKRDDVAETFPGRHDAGRAGFEAVIRCDGLAEGHHAVTVTLRDSCGAITQTGFVLDMPPRPPRSPSSTLRRKMTAAEAALCRRILAGLDWAPRFLLILPIERGDETIAAARHTLATLQAQVYSDWHLFVLRNPRGPAATTLRARLLDGFEALDGRVSVRSAIANLFLAQLDEPSQQPQLIAILQPGDTLSCDALIELAIETGMQRDVELFYSDERRINPTTGKLETFLKPQWSPDLLESMNYIGRLWCVRCELLHRIGATTQDLLHHGEYDLVLRCTEVACAVGRIAKVLCERTQAPSDYAREREALSRAMTRRGITGEVGPGAILGTHQLKRQPMGTPLVSIIIPTCAARGLIRTCLETLRTVTAYRNFEIICVENIPSGERRWRRWVLDHADRVLTISEPFDWARFNNRAAAMANGELLLFLNDDVEIADSGWLEALIVEAQRPEIGAVGALLLYPDGRIQHAGMFLAGARARHAFRYGAAQGPSYFGLAQMRRNVIAVTGTCLMTRRETFTRLGGFDQAYGGDNDLDYCLRLREHGLLTVFTPQATLFHHERASRGDHDDRHEDAVINARWHGVFMRGDPYFHPALSKENDDYVPDPEPARTICASRPVIEREEIRSILVVKLDHIGDCIIAMAALRRLAGHFPGARLAVLAAPTTTAIWAAMPEIAEIIPFVFFYSRSSLGRIDVSALELDQLRTQLEPYHFDLAVDLRKHPETRHLLLQTGARWLAGFDFQGRFPWLDITLEWEGDPRGAAKRRHAGDDLVNLVDAIATSAEPGGLPPVAISADKGAARWRHLFSKPVVCIHPAAGSPLRQWPAEHFAALIDRLVEADRVNIALIGAADERDIEKSILRQVQHRRSVRSMFGVLELAELPGFIARCTLFVGNNSGPQHLASALGIPTLGIHSGVVDATEWGPVGPGAAAIRREVSCAFCYLTRPEDCHRAIACLSGLRPSDVYAACRRLLAIASHRVPTDRPQPGSHRRCGRS